MAILYRKITHMALQQFGNWLFAPYTKIDTQREVHRRIAVISGTSEFCHNCITELFSDCSSEITVSVYDCKTITGAMRKHILGTECDIAVLDCHHRFSPGDVMAVAGTVRRNGCLVLCCPALETWPDTVQQPFVSFGFSPRTSLYIQRFIEKLTQAQCVAWLTETTHNTPDIASLYVAAHTERTQSLDRFASKDQKKAFHTLKRGVESGELRALVSAPRGRGKSALLGMFIADFLVQGKQVLLTSSIRENVRQVFQFIAEHHCEVKKDSDRLVFGEGNVQWVAPDSALLTEQHAHRFDLVVIDEAASFPLPITKRVIKEFKQWVLSTTLQGYEGSGNGFLLKLKPLLEHNNIVGICTKESTRSAHQDFIHIEMQTPLRWLENDPIEAVLSDICLFTPTEISNPMTEHLPSFETGKIQTAIRFQFVEFNTLCASQTQQIMTLLTLAHYQTTPDDLMRLMDSPDLLLAIVTLEKQIIGAAVINIEGGKVFSKNHMAEKIASGERRPKGHLGAQRLAFATTESDVLLNTCWRVNRIAVLPSLQNRGIGTRMTQYIEQQAIEQKISACITSYGSTETLDKFWRANRYSIVDRGRKPNKASGEVSALAVLPLSACAQRTVTLLQDYQAYLTEASSETTNSQLISLLQNKLRQFVQGKRTLDDVWPIVTKLAAAYSANCAHYAGIPLNVDLQGKSRTPSTSPLNNPEVREVLSKPELDIDTLNDLLSTQGIKSTTQVLRKAISTLLGLNCI